MYNLLLQLIWMISLGVIIYLIVIAVPRIQTDPLEGNESKKPFKNLYIEKLEKIDIALVEYNDKLLRRLKVFIMKADNFVSRWLNNNKEKI